jgi:hypothetical protein
LGVVSTGSDNTAVGYAAGGKPRPGLSNTEFTFFRLYSNTTGSNNIAVGASAGINLTTGSDNIYVGNAGSSSGEANKIRIGTTGTQRATFIA